MLVNLDSDDHMPPLQSGSLSPQADAVRSGMIDIHVVDGMFGGHLISFSHSYTHTMYTYYEVTHEVEKKRRSVVKKYTNE